MVLANAESKRVSLQRREFIHRSYFTSILAPSKCHPEEKDLGSFLCVQRCAILDTSLETHAVVLVPTGVFSRKACRIKMSKQLPCSSLFVWLLSCFIFAASVPGLRIKLRYVDNR